MASMNYCFTVCRAAEEKAQQKHHTNRTTTPAIDVPNSSSPSNGAYFFGRYFSFSLTPPTSTSTIENPLVAKATNLDGVNDHI